MKSNGGKRTLGAYFTGDAEFQTFHGILMRLKERGQLNIRTIAYSRFLRQQPYCKDVFLHSDIQPTIRFKRIFELFQKTWLNGIDALLVIRDPLFDPSNPRRRRYITENNLTTIQLGHSVYPEHLIRRRITSGLEPLDFHSELKFEYEELPEFRSIFSAATLRKIHYSGLIKRFHVTPEASQYAEKLSSFENTMLFTHEFRITGRFSDSKMFQYFQMVKAFAIENPNTALIIRPHRGRAKPWHKEFDAELQKKCSNVFFANHKSGLFKGALVNDLLKVSDALVSTPSTAIVDAVYMDVPVAVALNDDSKFDNLAQVNDFQSLMEFIRDPSAYSGSYARIRSHYGDIDVNIERTCEKIESFVSNLPRRV